jgi:hypothetical protein
MAMRRLNLAANHAIHAVHDVARFADLLQAWSARLEGYDLGGLEETVESAGYQGVEVAQICHLLRSSQRALPAMVARVCNLVRRPVFMDAAELIAG